MTFRSDSCLPLLLAALLLASLSFAPLLFVSPAMAATAKKPIKPAAKPAIVEPQPDPAILVAQSRDAQGKGETELALRLAQAAIVADPARPSSYDALADIYAAANAPDFARNYYNEALSIDPTDVSAQKAIAALNRGATDKRAANAEGIKTGNP
jgi:tetratricopeptide (TPR) repeat protein